MSPIAIPEDVILAPTMKPLKTSPAAPTTTAASNPSPANARYTTSFTHDETMRTLLLDLERDGYAVVKSAIPKERAEKYVDACYEWLESFGLGFKRREPETVKVGTMPIGNQAGLYHNYAIAHEKWVWDIRSEPGVIDAFAQVYGTQELLVSYDGINVSFPNRTDMPPNVAWPHQDQDPRKPGFRCLQGIVNLCPNGPEDGGLLVCKGAYKVSEEFHEAHKDEPKIEFWTEDWYGFSEKGLEWLRNNGFEWVKVCAEPGDLIVWDSRAPHYNCNPTGKNARIATYVCMLPKAGATEAELESKKRAFKELKTSTHWPYGAHFHDGIAFRDGKPDPANRMEPIVKPELSERALKLTGVLDY